MRTFLLGALKELVSGGSGLREGTYLGRRMLRFLEPSLMERKQPVRCLQSSFEAVTISVSKVR